MDRIWFIGKWEYNSTAKLPKIKAANFTAALIFGGTFFI